MLSTYDEIDRFLRLPGEALIAGHRHGFGQGERGDGMGIHGTACPVAEVATLLRNHHSAGEVVETLLDKLLIRALLMRVAGTQKAKQCESG